MNNKDRKTNLTAEPQKVYLLQLSILPVPSKRLHSEFDDFVLREWHLSDVFTTLQKAIDFGTKEMTKKIEKISTKLNGKWTQAEIANKLVEYDFKVLELNPDVSRNSEFYEYESADFGFESGDVVVRNREGAHWDDYVEWNYDYTGNLRYRGYHYGEDSILFDNRPFYNCDLIFPEDDTEDAGTKFKVGEFVKVNDFLGYGIREFYQEGYNPDEIHLLKNRYFDDVIYVVAEAPGKKSDCERAIWHNHYELGRYDERGNYKAVHLHERYLRKYDAKLDGELLPDDPLQNLLKLREEALERRRKQSRIALFEDDFEE